MIACLPVLALAGASVGGHAWRARVWTIAEGLPQGTVNQIVQADDGALWIATFGGLLCFDGVAYRHLDAETTPGMRSNRLTALVAVDGEVHALAEAGEYYACNGVDLRSLHRGASKPYECVVLVDPPGERAWARTTNGGVLSSRDGEWTELLAGTGAAAGYESLCLDDAGVIHAADRARILRWTDDGTALPDITAPSAVHVIAPAKGGGLWAGLADGIARVQGGVVTRVRIEPALDRPVEALLDDGAGGLWFGTTDGPRHAHPTANGFALEPVPAGFSERFLVRCFLTDREGNVWAGSRGQGLARISRAPVEFRPVPDTSGVIAAESDGAGGTWVVSGCGGYGGVQRVSADGTVEPLAALAGVAGCGHALHRDRRGRLWIGVGPRLLRIESEGAAALPVFETDGVETAGIWDDDEGGTWIVMKRGRVVRLDDADRVVLDIELPRSAHTGAVASDGTFWIGGGGVLMRVAHGRVEEYGAAAGMPRAGIRSILSRPDGTLWIATYGAGLAWFDGVHARRISRAEGLPDAALTYLAADDAGRLWVSSNAGLLVLEIDELLDVVEGRRARVDPVLLGPESGMVEANYGSPAGYRDADGRLGFGTISGVARVDPARFPFQRAAPRAAIESAQADDASLPLDDGVRVPASTSRLVFGFTAFALTAPERVRFRYRLVGYDDDWVASGAQRTAVYTSVPPAEYEFQVLARNESGVWSSVPVSIAVVVEPAWWQTPAFRGSCFAAIVLALLAAHGARTRVLSRRAAAQLRAAQERIEAEEDASRLRDELAHVARVATAGELATSLAHEVNQPLAAIVANAQAGRRYLARGDDSGPDMDEILADIAREGERASDVIRRLRAFLRKRPAERREIDLVELLRETLPLVRRDFAVHGILARVVAVPDVPRVLGDPVQLQQVLVNLLKNACDSAAASGARSIVDIEVRPKPQGVVVSVRDRGRGLDPAVRERLFEAFTTTKPEGMGLGLAICRSIVEAHGGRIEAADAEGGGAVFRVALPAHRRDDAATG